MTRSRNSFSKIKKKYLNYTKSFSGRKKNCFKLSKQYYIRSLNKSYFGKKTKKRFFLSKKIIIINYISRLYFGLSYNKLIFLLKINNCNLNKLNLIHILLKLIS